MKGATPLELIFAPSAAALITAAGIFIVKKRFKNEVEYTKKQAVVFIAASAVFLLAAAFLTAIFASPEDWTVFSIVRTVSVICWMYFAAVIDFKLFVIPNDIIIGMLIELALIFIPEAFADFSGFKYTITTAVLGGVIMGVLFLLGRVFSKGSMGMGDVKAVMMCGFFLGMDSAAGMVFWALVISVVTGLVLIIAKKAKLKSKIPMAPFFFLGALVSNAIYIISEL